MSYKSCTVKNAQFDSAVQKGDVVLARRLLMHASVDVDYSADGRSTPLHKATLNGDVQMVKLLLANGAKVNSSGRNALHVAALAKDDNVEIARMLLEAGVPIDAVDGDQKYTPLHHALEHGNNNIALLLLDYGADLHAKTFNSYTPLYMAIQYGRDFKQFLVTAMQSGMNDMAIEHGYVNMARELLKRGANINDKTRTGLTMLHSACNIESVEKILLLLEFGANVNVRDRTKKTPFAKIKNDDCEAAYEMLKHIATLYTEDPNLVDQADIERIQGNAAFKGFFDSMLLEIKKMKVINIYNGITYHQLFSKTVEQIVPLMRNEEFLEGLEWSDPMLEFKHYGCQLSAKLCEAAERRDYYRTVGDCLNEAFGYGLPSLVIHEILKYVAPTDVLLNANDEDDDESLPVIRF